MSLFKYTVQTGNKLDKNDLKNKGHLNFPVWHKFSQCAWHVCCASIYLLAVPT